MIALKKVSSTDISHALVRYDWISRTKYDEYRDNYSSSNTTNVTGVSNFFDGRGYVITDEFKVYKCLKTGMSGGSTVASTVKPTSVDTANPQVTVMDICGNSCIQLSLLMLSNLLPTISYQSNQ